MRADPTPGNPCTDPLSDAITVLEHVCIQMPSARPDTEDAQNRVNLALEYLRMALVERRAEPKVQEPLAAITDLLRGGPTS